MTMSSSLLPLTSAAVFAGPNAVLFHRRYRDDDAPRWKDSAGCRLTYWHAIFGLGVQSTASCCHVTYTSFSGAVCMICCPELVHSEEFVADLAAKAQLDHVIH